jgi:hypothetical protein|tara:strand:+ start:958 stop:1182 length:225 start_codon:yes stop_codon:yes gene_type:complete
MAMEKQPILKKAVDPKFVWGIIVFLIAQSLAGIEQFYSLKTRVAVLESQQNGLVATVTEVKDKVEKIYLILLEK